MSPSCEKCWHDAHTGDPYRSVADEYARLIEERRDNPCTPEEQAGEDAERCPKCERMTVHQHVHVCVICGAKP
jgi:hypothetical protein